MTDFITKLLSFLFKKDRQAHPMPRIAEQELRTTILSSRNEVTDHGQNRSDTPGR